VRYDLCPLLVPQRPRNGLFRGSTPAVAGVKRLAALTATVVALPAYGGSVSVTKTEYEARVKSIEAATIGKPSNESVPRTPPAFARFFAEEQAKLRAFADRLSKLRPPTEVQHAQDELVAGMRGAANDIDPLIRTGLSGHRIRDRAFEQQLLTDTATRRHIAAARAEFQAKGNRIGTNQGASSP